MDSKILGTRINPISTDIVLMCVTEWSLHRESRYICVANVHMVMEGCDRPDYQAIVNQADLVVPDGMPLVWVLRKMGFRQQQRIYGPELTLRMLSMASERGIPIGLLGSTPETLELLKKNIALRFSGIQIAYAFSPPFRSISPDEDEQMIETINQSAIGILFVGLGCPKQEMWMAAHSGKVKAVMVGVGAAFDFIAGTKRQAPKWMRTTGLEWLFRLSQEPGRLWQRYFHHNSRFLLRVAHIYLKDGFHTLNQ